MRTERTEAPLIPTSQTQFMSTATPAGYEFVKDAQGKVTHLIVRGNVPDTKAVCAGMPLCSGRQRNVAEALRVIPL